MRLTLRTMLAYRDRVLRPADAEDLHRRIQSSEDAGNLLRRIDSLSKRHFAPSTTIVGKGLSGDPNSYSEYLDDVLAAEKVPEFEKTCLESDVHLNELAECHSLLSSAIHTRVRVPDHLHALAMEVGNVEQRQAIKDRLKERRRVQGNGQIVRADLAHPIQAPQGQTGEKPGLNEEQIVCVQAPMVASGGTSIREQGLNLENSKLAHEVPEYLVGKNRGSWRIPVAIGVLVAALGLLVWQALGPWDKIQALFAGDTGIAGETEQVDAAAPALGSANASANPEESSTQGNTETGNTKPENLVTPNPDSSKDQNQPASANGPMGDSISETNEPPPSGETGEGGNEPTVDNATNNDETNSGQKPPQNIEPKDASGPSTPQGSAWLPNDAEEKQAVLLAITPSGPKRLAPGDALVAGSELVVPPFYGTTLDLPGGTLWETSGASMLTIGSQDSHHLESSLCRAMVRAGPRGNQLHFKSPVGTSKITLGRGGSVAAVEVAYRLRKQGPITDRTVAVPIQVLVCGDGVVSCEFNAKTYNLQTGTGLAIIEGEKPREFNLLNIPTWFRKSNIRPIDKLAREDLSARLTATNGDLSETLLNLAKSRQPYLASLASQTCMLLKNWSPFVQHTLADERQSSFWHQSIELARKISAADSDRAKALEQAFDAHSQGSPSYQILTGLPSDSYADSKGLDLLIKSLDSELLSERVLAINHLQRTTGIRMNFMPHQPSRTSLQKWRLELSKGRLQFQPPPDLIIERIAP